MIYAPSRRRTKIVLNHNKIVIGSSLKALMFAYINELPIFFSVAERPFRFDFLDPNWDLTALKLENPPSVLTSTKGKMEVGIPANLLWERLMFILSFSGKAPLSNLCKTMRYTGSTMVFSDDYAKLVEVGFEHCYYFGDRNCYKLVNEKVVENTQHLCYDWIAFNRGGKHKIDFIKTKDEFVKNIWFYSSDRIDGNSPVKDACVVSHLSQEELLNFDYSATMARFKMIYEMEKRGMKGKFNGIGPNGKPKHYKFRTSYITREIQKKELNVESPQQHIQIMDCAEDELYKDLISASVSYDKLLRDL